jgi:transmembrane sensor
MSRQDIGYLLDRYLSGEATPEERELVEKWLSDKNQPDNEWERLSQPAREKWLNDLFIDIEKTIEPETKVIPMYNRSRQWFRLTAVAATVAIFFFLYLSVPTIKAWFGQTKLVAMQVSQQQQITLSDGSTVYINAGSEFKHPDHFNGKTREVYLSGEAYFDIKHDPSHPFIVHTGKLITTVLGTAFNIKAPKLSPDIIVTVNRGKVSVSDEKQLIGYITPNQQITYNIETTKHEQRNVNAEEVISWQQRELRFDDMRFEDVAKTLQERFNVKISFTNDKVKNCRFSGTALKGKTIDQVLKVICAFNNSTYHYQSDHSILIDGPGCN